MQPERFALADSWFQAARDDLTVARDYSERMPHVACFHSQQAGEKALNAILVVLAGDIPRTRLMTALLDELEGLKFALDTAMREDALALAKFYLATRYPDALGGVTPGAVYVKEEAQDAVSRAMRLLDRAGKAVAQEREDVQP